MTLYNLFISNKEIILKTKILFKNFLLKLKNLIYLIISNDYKNFNKKITIYKESLSFDLNDDVSKIKLILNSYLLIRNLKISFEQKKKLFLFCLKICEIKLNKNFIDRYFYFILDRSVSQKNQIKMIKDVKMLYLNETYSLVMLKKISYAFGLYKFSYYLRLYLEKRILNLKQNNKTNLIYKLYISLYYNKEKIFKNTVDLLSDKFFLNRNCKIFHPNNCYSFFFKNSSFKNNLYFNERDNIFKKIIENKSIAIIGPSNSDLDQKEEIDNFDIVIRMNQEAQLENNLEKFIGTKTDVIYFGGGLIHSRKKVVFDFIKKTNVKFVCFKNNKTVNEFRYNKILSRQWLEFPWSFDSSHMMIQNILFDIICFNPKKIKVFNVDMYVGKKKYISNKYKAGINSRSPVFDLHDPYVNYRIIKFFYYKNLIEVDTNVKKILNYSDRLYIKTLEEVNKENVFPAFNLIY